MTNNSVESLGQSAGVVQSRLARTARRPMHRLLMQQNETVPTFQFHYCTINIQRGYVKMALLPAPLRITTAALMSPGRSALSTVVLLTLSDRNNYIHLSRDDHLDHEQGLSAAHDLHTDTDNPRG